MKKEFIHEMPQEELKKILGGTKIKELNHLNTDSDIDWDACSEGCRDGCKDGCKSCQTNQTGGGDTLLRRSYPLLDE